MLGLFLTSSHPTLHHLPKSFHSVSSISLDSTPCLPLPFLVDLDKVWSFLLHSIFILSWIGSVENLPSSTLHRQKWTLTSSQLSAQALHTGSRVCKLLGARFHDLVPWRFRLSFTKIQHSGCTSWIQLTSYRVRPIAKPSPHHFPTLLAYFVYLVPEELDMI